MGAFVRTEDTPPMSTGLLCSRVGAGSLHFGETQGPHFDSHYTVSGRCANTGELCPSFCQFQNASGTVLNQDYQRQAHRQFTGEGGEEININAVISSCLY